MPNTPISTPPNNDNGYNNNKSRNLSIYLDNLSRQFNTNVNPEFYMQLQILLKRERKSMIEWMADQILEYLHQNTITHENFSLDEFCKNPEFIPTPKFFDSLDRWKKYVTSLEEGDLKRFDYRMEELLSQARMRWQYL